LQDSNLESGEECSVYRTLILGILEWGGGGPILRQMNGILIAIFTAMDPDWTGSAIRNICIPVGRVLTGSVAVSGLLFTSGAGAIVAANRGSS
jgi:hypothetical protein